MRNRALQTATILMAALVAFAARGQHAHEGHGAHAPHAGGDSPGFYLPEPLPLEPFTLVDHDSQPFTRDRLEGRWTLLVFGYTHCPDVCPVTLAQVRDTRALLEQEAPALDVAAVFVSIDPERDTPERVADYVAAFDEDLVGVTGTAEAIAAFAGQLRVKYAPTERSAGGYLVDHSSAVALLTPRAEIAALFSVPLRPERLAADLRAIAAPADGGDERAPARELTGGGN
ncbi:MAG TPA: SCO family protein [Gammaproteobacteria bacterium]